MHKTHDGTAKVRPFAKELVIEAHRDLWAGCPTPSGQRVLLAIAMHENMGVEDRDVRTAFLHAPCKGKVAVTPPSGEAFQNSSELWMCRGSLYGLRSAPPLFQRWLAGQWRCGWV